MGGVSAYLLIVRCYVETLTSRNVFVALHSINAKIPRKFNSN